MKYKVTLNGKVYEVEVEKGEAILLDEYEAAAPAPVAQQAAPVAATPAAPVAAPAANVSGESVVAPLPGTVLSVNATVGKAVKAGEVLLIIEAMKMENEVLAPRDGTVSAVLVQKGTNVETGTALVALS